MDLLEFILEAKVSGYATGGEGNEIKFEDGSKGFEYAKSGFRYLDRYFGFNPFSGTEFVFDNSGSVVWTMNYYGEVYEICDSPAEVHKTLKLAMQNISPLFPFRGPKSFDNAGL